MSRRILLVEDDFFVALEMAYQLKAAGFEVTGIAKTAEEAVAMTEADKPDLAIMDIQLAGRRDGIEAAIDLASKFGIRSIFATAHDDDTTRRRAAAARPLGWLQKPYVPALLVAMVNEVFAPN